MEPIVFHFFLNKSMVSLCRDITRTTRWPQCGTTQEPEEVAEHCPACANLHGRAMMEDEDYEDQEYCQRYRYVSAMEVLGLRLKGTKYLKREYDEVSSRR